MQHKVKGHKVTEINMGPICLTYVLLSVFGLFRITDRIIKWTSLRTFQIGVYLQAVWAIRVPASAAPASASPPSGRDRYSARRLLGFASWLRKYCQQRDLHNCRNREEWGIAGLSVPLLNVCVVLLPQFALSHDTSVFNRAIIIHFMCRDTHGRRLAEEIWIHLTDVYLDHVFKNRKNLKHNFAQHLFY